MDIVGISLAVLVCALLGRHVVKERRYREEHRASAENVFKNLSHLSDDPTLRFEGSAAQIVDDKDHVEQIKGVFLAYTLTRIAKNASGEYFWFHFRSDSPPQFKHINQSRAKILLKGKYIAPASK